LSNLEEIKFWYENLNKINLDQIELFYDKEVLFKDPFNEFRGIDKVKKIFYHMLSNLENPQFAIIDTIENDEEAFLTWDFLFKFNDKNYKIHGSSHLKYNKEQIISYHRDYWDVGEEVLLKVPFVRLFYSFFRKKLALPKDKT
tara:strand:+ start:1697 stop:2125 length:429 start_codon:yes stop_codon:yes gene_type:complete